MCLAGMTPSQAGLSSPNYPAAGALKPDSSAKGDWNGRGVICAEHIRPTQGVSSL